MCRAGSWDGAARTYRDDGTVVAQWWYRGAWTVLMCCSGAYSILSPTPCTTWWAEDRGGSPCQPEYDIIIIQSPENLFVEGNKKVAEIKPAPFVLIPLIGETLDFVYSHPENSRIQIRIFDISGKFITSLVDKYYENSATVFRDEFSSAWDGRDHLGQIVSPGTYIMHIEAMNPATGETQTDAAPVVVGVKNWYG